MKKFVLVLAVAGLSACSTAQLTAGSAKTDPARGPAGVQISKESLSSDSRLHAIWVPIDRKYLSAGMCFEKCENGGKADLQEICEKVYAGALLDDPAPAHNTYGDSGFMMYGVCRN